MNTQSHHAFLMSTLLYSLRDSLIPLPGSKFAAILGEYEYSTRTCTFIVNKTSAATCRMSYDYKYNLCLPHQA